eukprot:5172137-Pyramimonas_sp.AAC.1
MVFNVWRGPRILRLGAGHRLVVQYATSGRPAGSCFNDIVARGYAMKPVDGFVRRNPSVDLSSYIDDDTVSCCGTKEAVIESLASAASDLH